MNIIEGQIYRHFKGNLYKVITVATHSETGEELVIYQALYGDNRIYARPRASFTSRVDREKYPDASQEYRFEICDSPVITPVSYTEKTSSEDTDTKDKESIPAPSDKLTEFLDADDFSEKLRILQSMKNTITDQMIDTIAFSLDLELNEGNTDQRYSELLNCVCVREKFENSRLRGR